MKEMKTKRRMTTSERMNVTRILMLAGVYDASEKVSRTMYAHD